ncbi:MAG: type VI secretion system-associated protein TagF [Pseudomonadales bacterium]|uniref:Type VI secretion system-associated protein n=1 Tax=Oleiphilus messinensis TaxID=141451 RepID=A0A1Y0IGA7_9GAMM|nr:type VI secretion system-associated protein TagF [Oleiphilus messinensis]ARU58856.1 type VI secretion system-associated protein [Oleiphilus messinensis]MCG8610379.1 type VI secretion system-associated protein TagF [Pseudomonadales bacterium]
MTGLFGKLPGHGDFVQYNVAPDFVSVWDSWLQQALLASQEELQSQWLELYLVGPIWRFALSPGIVDHENAWAGIMLPSVDSVGRYYPLTLVAQLPENTTLSVFMSLASAWFTEIENVAVEALEQGWKAEEIAYKLATPSVEVIEAGMATDVCQDKDYQTVIHIDNPESRVLRAAPGMSDFLLRRLGEPYCLWWSTGSQEVSPVLLTTNKLPRPVSYTAMLTGKWSNWYWREFN